MPIPTPTPSPKYDTEEADRIISDAVERIEPSLAEKEHETRVLVTEFTKLAEKSGLKHSKDEGDIVVTVPRKGGVRIAIREFGKIVLYPINPITDPSAEKEELVFDYDRIEERLVGEGYDEYLIPIPGESKKRRSALAVLGEKVMAMIETQASNRD